MVMAMVTLMQSATVAAQLPPPNLTHVNNVNAAGNATLHWDVFSPVGAEEFLQSSPRKRHWALCVTHVAQCCGASLRRA